MRIRIKICGITEEADAMAAVEAGADALGFVFYERSARAVTRETAARIVRRLPPFVARVGLFVNAEARWVRETAEVCGLDTLQFHGSESPEYCRDFQQVAYKAFRVGGAADLEQLPRFELAAWLLDSSVSGQYGGTGTTFDWALAREAKRWGRPILLAGGLRVENVAQAIRQARPYAVDVSSGVESAPGRKDPQKIRDFVRAVQTADRD